MKIKIKEVWLDKERFSPGLGCTVPGAWIAETDRGSFAICREYEACTPEQAMSIYIANAGE